MINKPVRLHGFALFDFNHFQRDKYIQAVLYIIFSWPPIGVTLSCTLTLINQEQASRLRVVLTVNFAINILPSEVIFSGKMLVDNPVWCAVC